VDAAFTPGALLFDPLLPLPELVHFLVHLPVHLLDLELLVLDGPFLIETSEKSVVGKI
jgi:hypothetical protein